MFERDLFTRCAFRLDPWGVDYEPPVKIEADVATVVEPADCGVEGGEWAPRRPDPATPRPDRVAFLDGRRRLDARLVGHLDGKVLHAAFATIAVGAIVLDRPAKTATLTDLAITRALAVGGGIEAPPQRVGCPLGGADILAYDTPLVGPENGPRVAIDLVQQAMLDREAALAGRLADGDALVVRDGPIARPDPDGRMVGYVKTMSALHLPTHLAGILWELAPGERTPLFYISNAGTYSWYMRQGAGAGDPSRAGTHGLHGIVRLEVSANLSTAAAARMADVATALVPAFASQAHRDPRAPQNLTPVGALERELGRRMGDPTIIARRIRHHLTETPA